MLYPNGRIGGNKVNEASGAEQDLDHQGLGNASLRVSISGRPAEGFGVVQGSAAWLNCYERAP